MYACVVGSMCLMRTLSGHNNVWYIIASIILQFVSFLQILDLNPCYNTL